MKKTFYVLGLVVMFLPAAFTHAAVLDALVQRGVATTTERITLSLDTQGESVNAVEAHFSFDPSAYKIISIDDGGSIMNLWITPPAFSNTAGTIDLAGIIPAGEVTSNGKLMNIIMVPASGTAPAPHLTLSSVSVLLNDGKGTAAKTTFLQTTGSTFTAESTSSIDTQAPDPFTPEIASDPNLFDGKYMLVFGATDQQSGIDHYEVLEAGTGPETTNVSSWIQATSPYLLTDQTLSSDIYVRALDRAGNFRTVKLPATNPYNPHKPLSVVSIIEMAVAFILLLLLIVEVVLLTKKENVNEV